MELLRLYSDTPEFRQRLHREIIDETYPKLHELLHPLTDNDIDKAIQDWNGKIESKHAVVRYMEKHGREKDTAAWLAHEFDGGDGKTPFSVRPESPEGTVLPWPKVQRRIAQLIKEDRFYTEAEQDRFDNIDPIAIREALAERGIVNGELVDEEKLDNDPFIQRVMADVEAISRESVPADEPEQPSPHNLRVLVSDEEYAAARGTLRERTSYDPAVPPYNVGDIVYLDDRPHQITELRDDTVQLLPTGMSYPIYRAESRERFEQLLREDNRNDFYTEFLPANLDTVDQDLRDVLAHGLIGEADKAELSELLRNGKSNQEVALWLSRAYPNIVETMELETGETADYRTMPEGIELEVLDAACCSSSGARLRLCCAGCMPVSWTVLSRNAPNRLPKPRPSKPRLWLSIRAIRTICPMMWLFRPCEPMSRSRPRLLSSRKRLWMRYWTNTPFPFR